MNCLAGFVLFAFYTGVLTSLMTATPAGVDIHSFQDILDKDYQPMVLGESADSLTMQNSPPGTVLHRIYYEVGRNRIQLKMDMYFIGKSDFENKISSPSCLPESQSTT